MALTSLFWRRLGCFGLCLFLGIASARAEADRIAFVGSGYGKAEVAAILKTVIRKDLQGTPIEEVGEFLEADRFKEFRGVVLAGGERGRVYTPEECQTIEEWVKGGGRLLLIRQAPRLLMVDPSKDRDKSYLFGRSYYLRQIPVSAVNEPNSPLLAGALDANAQPFWLSGNILLKGEGWSQVIGHNELILVGKRTVGEGVVYFLGNELFRMEKEGRDHKKVEEAQGWARLVRNIIEEMSAKP